MSKYLLVTKGHTKIIEGDPSTIFYDIDLKYPTDFISLIIMEDLL
jgi:hypothetical protein